MEIWAGKGARASLEECDMSIELNFPELYFKQLNGGALVGFGKGGWSDQLHASGLHRDCESGIAMLVSSFQDRAGRLELEIQKSGGFLQQFMLKLAFQMAILTPLHLGVMFTGVS
jgi:hypothetical protein